MIVTHGTREASIFASDDFHKKADVWLALEMMSSVIKARQLTI